MRHNRHSKKASKSKSGRLSPDQKALKKAQRLKSSKKMRQVCRLIGNELTKKANSTGHDVTVADVTKHARRSMKF